MGIQVQHRQVGWLTKNRKTGELVREQMPLMKKARMLLLFNPVTEWIDTTHIFRYFLHEKTDHSKSKEVRAVMLTEEIRTLSTGAGGSAIKEADQGVCRLLQD